MVTKSYQPEATASKSAKLIVRYPKPCKLARNKELRRLVIEKLQLKWSPEQISGWLKRKRIRLSHETIYKTLYIRSRQILDPALMEHLRRGHRMRHGKKHSTSGERGTINIVNGESIHSRPKTIDERRSIGHWEGDLVTGSNNTHIATLVDRKSRFTIILKLAGKDAGSVNAALIKAFNKLPSKLKKSLTWDRGMELAMHSELSKKTGVPVYFCDPQSPWQRGTNENTNSLIRQYFPKKTCLAQHSFSALRQVANQLNERPRKTLKFRTPMEIIERAVALNG